MLAHDFWRRAAGGDTAIVGKTIRLDGRPHVVIGVLPRDADDGAENGGEDDADPRDIERIADADEKGPRIGAGGVVLDQRLGNLEAGFPAEEVEADLHQVDLEHPRRLDGGSTRGARQHDERADRVFRRVMAPNYAGPFVRVGRLFAPRYRQASLYSLTTLREDGLEKVRRGLTS